MNEEQKRILLSMAIFFPAFSTFVAIGWAVLHFVFGVR